MGLVDKAAEDASRPYSCCEVAPNPHSTLILQHPIQFLPQERCVRLQTRVAVVATYLIKSTDKGYVFEQGPSRRGLFPVAPAPFVSPSPSHAAYINKHGRSAEGAWLFRQHVRSPARV